MEQHRALGDLVLVPRLENGRRRRVVGRRRAAAELVAARGRSGKHFAALRERGALDGSLSRFAGLVLAFLVQLLAELPLGLSLVAPVAEQVRVAIVPGSHDAIVAQEEDLAERQVLEPDAA